MQKNIEQRLMMIVEDYFACKNHFRLLTFSNGKPDYNSPFYRFYRNVEITFQRLDKDEQVVIRYEYFYHRKPDWWKSIFDIHTFQFVKEKAVYKFVRFFDEIH